MFSKERKLKMPAAGDALPGRDGELNISGKHFVNSHTMKPPFAGNLKQAMFGLGCFWGAERKFWTLDGVYVTAVGYAGGITPNPTYHEVCSGLTGHNEVVLIVYDPEKINYAMLLKVFWEAHDPTQGMRQGNDIGTQYRSGIYCFDENQLTLAEQSRKTYNANLRQAGYPEITTEIITAPPFYYAEEYHQQYLAKNPQGYCGLGGTGVSCNIK